jgi:hypothetical protein
MSECVGCGRGTFGRFCAQCKGERVLDAPGPVRPTVGRQVHYYGLGLRWSRDGSRGPFAATVVRVHADGTVNLNVLYPSEVTDRGGHTYGSEIIENVRYREDAATVPLPDRVSDRAWAWPPRFA